MPTRGDDQCDHFLWSHFFFARTMPLRWAGSDGFVHVLAYMSEVP